MQNNFSVNTFYNSEARTIVPTFLQFDGISNIQRIRTTILENIRCSAFHVRIQIRANIGQSFQGLANQSYLATMPILIAGGNSREATEREMSVFAICALCNRRDACKRQLNIIGFALFTAIMTAWSVKISLGCSVVLLVVCITFILYSLYNESQVLRQIQRELLQLLRSTPQEDIDQYFNQAGVQIILVLDTLRLSQRRMAN